ncbi:hypothetical protein [Sphingomonas sp. ERG5]|uniref:hypothetical protein n=1 Tax=Sphingomonas sp. ERG5 TaxID=1381597 RepID=UPI00054B03E7|nr:hypothetical protein [Sphingomonas sp. ERG5]
MIALIMAAAVAAPLSPPLVAASRVDLAERVVRIGDIVDLAVLSAARRADLSRRVVAKLPMGRASMTMSRAALVLLVRRAVPGLSPVSGGMGPITLAARIRLDTVPGGTCAISTASVARGAALTADIIAPAACREDGAASIVFDRRANVALAGSDLAAGAYLGRLATPRVKGIRKGEPLTLVSTVGPVRIDRVVTAMQDGNGKRIFVRDQDGQVFAAPLRLAVEGSAK